MKNRSLPYLTPPSAMGCAKPPASAADPRPGRKPGRGRGGRARPALFALAAGVCMLACLWGARPALAKSSPKVERLRAIYSLDENVGESDGRLIRRRLLKLLLRSDVKLFLSVIKKAEAGEPDLMVGGCRAHSLKKHPALLLPKSCRYPVSGWGYSTASGNYQLTLENWLKIAPFLELRDFSELNQALAALELIRRGGGAASPIGSKGRAIKLRIQGGFLKLLQGDVKSALCMATHDWASSSCSTLPANNKIVYAHLADEIRKSEADRLRPRLSENGERSRGAHAKAKAPLASSGREVKTDILPTKGPKPEGSAARGKR